LHTAINHCGVKTYVQPCFKSLLAVIFLTVFWSLRSTPSLRVYQHRGPTAGDHIRGWGQFFSPGWAAPADRWKNSTVTQS